MVVLYQVVVAFIQSYCAGQCLHSLQQGTNPYMTVMSIICKTMAVFDDDHMIPAYGFGDVTARDRAVFSFGPGNTPVHTLDNVLNAYRAMLPHIKLSGPTSFAPAIQQAIKIVHASGGRYHILVIIADGQVCNMHFCTTFCSPELAEGLCTALSQYFVIHVRMRADESAVCCAGASWCMHGEHEGSHCGRICISPQHCHGRCW